jgi:tetratricopeptide (TPR) repeat protein
MTELFKLLVNELWRTLIEPLLKRLDKIDLILITVLILLAVYWWKFWEGYCSLTEKFLWGALIATFSVVWFTLRINTRKEKKKSILIQPAKSKIPDATLRQRRRRLIIVKVVVSVAICGAWLFGAYRVYRLQRFEGTKSGIQVACFENDPGGVYQLKLVKYIEDSIAENGLEDLVDVEILSSRLSEPDAARARQLGERSRAKIVIWGRITGPEKIKSRMVLINTEGAYDSTTPFGKYAGHQKELNDLYDLPAKLEMLARAVAIFLAGHVYFQRQEYDKALRYFERARQELQATTEQQSEASPEKALLGSIDFYIGNVLYFQSDQELTKTGRSKPWKAKVAAATQAYKAAIELTSHPIETDRAQYIEPLNNFGFLANIEGKPETAIKPLEDADVICRQRAKPDALCMIVIYNLGEAKRRIGQHEDAVKLFERAITSIETNASDNRQMEAQLPFLHQACAFSYVKIGDEATEKRLQSYQRAEEELDKARAILSKTQDSSKSVLMNFNDITRARIQIGRGGWSEAIETLTAVGNKMKDPDINLLLSIAYSCGNHPEDADRNFGLYTKAYFEARVIDEWKWKEDTAYEKKFTLQCPESTR